MLDTPENQEETTSGKVVNEQKLEAKKLSVRVSEALFFKIKSQAEDEGISIEEFAHELLAEGVVLRAWEIVEKKGHLRGNHQNGNGMQHNHNHNGNGGHGRGRRGGGFQGRRNNHQRTQNMMEDKAQFLEYVRNQERNAR